MKFKPDLTNLETKTYKRTTISRSIGILNTIFIQIKLPPFIDLNVKVENSDENCFKSLPDLKNAL